MFNPPRIPTVPQAPLPQTNFGVLEHTGLPFSEPENITDVPPDFGWMCELQAYLGMITYSKDAAIGSELQTLSVNCPFSTVQQVMWDQVPIWQHIPMTCAKWWNGTIGFKFEAICPPRVTGKLLVRYEFLPNQAMATPRPFVNDTLKRGICKEWDLGQSHIFEFDVTALCPIQARPTWLPERAFQNGSAVSPYAAQQLNSAITNLGSLRIEPAQQLQPGSIFPDSIRILVYRSIKSANFYTPTDPRSAMPHILMRPWTMKPVAHTTRKNTS